MGLKDLVPDDKKSSSSGSQSRTQESEDRVVIGAGRLKKEFTKEKWEDVRHVLINEMGVVPNEVVNNWPAQERYETIHEAALIANQDATLEELGLSPSKCDICGRALGESGVVIAGLEVCISHTAGEIYKTLNGD